MTPKELSELGHLARASTHVAANDLPLLDDDAALNPGTRKSMALLREFATHGNDNRPVTVDFDFFAMPVAVEGNGKAERILIERTRLDEEGRAVSTGERYAIEATMVVSCIGYRTPPIEGVPYDAQQGRFANQEGRIAPGLYCVGWARRGPTGTIDTNRPDGYDIVERIAADLTTVTQDKAGGAGLDALLAERGVAPVSFSDWQRIDEAERSHARNGTPREKFTSIADMLAVAHG